jgi:glutathione S-transferase
MKLYVTPRAVNPRRVLWFLAEKGLAVDTVPIDIGKLEHKADAYTALNPAGRVPALQLDDGTVISESIAICRYFEELQPDPPLFGTGPLGRAIVEMWQRRIEFELLSTVAAVFRHSHPFMAAMETPQVPAWADANRPKAAEFLTALDHHLADRDFVCGAEFSIADISGVIGVDFMRLPKIPVPDGLENLARWRAAISARPAFVPA